MVLRKQVFIADSVASLRHAVCTWLIRHGEQSTSGIVKLKLSNMANEMLNDTTFELIETVEGYEIIEDFEQENEENEIETEKGQQENE